MKRILIFSALLISYAYTHAQRFEDCFEDRTLRLDYTFSGNSDHQELYVDEMISIPRWYGKRQHLAEVPLKGNGQIIMEWLSTEESKRVQKSF